MSMFRFFQIIQQIQDMIFVVTLAGRRHIALRNQVMAILKVSPTTMSTMCLRGI
ncbi:unnamed protein product [Brassica rapa subsp. trilocularis]